MYGSSDGGQTWSAVSTLKPFARRPRIAVHPFDANRLFFYADRGLGRSEDGGATWTFNSRLAQTYYFRPPSIDVTLVQGHGTGFFVDFGAVESPASIFPCGATVSGGEGLQVKSSSLGNLTLTWQLERPPGDYRRTLEMNCPDAANPHVELPVRIRVVDPLEQQNRFPLRFE